MSNLSASDTEQEAGWTEVVGKRTRNSPATTGNNAVAAGANPSLQTNPFAVLAEEASDNEEVSDTEQEAGWTEVVGKRTGNNPATTGNNAAVLAEEASDNEEASTEVNGPAAHGGEDEERRGRARIRRIRRRARLRRIRNRFHNGCFARNHPGPGIVAHGGIGAPRVAFHWEIAAVHKTEDQSAGLDGTTSDSNSSQVVEDRQNGSCGESQTRDASVKDNPSNVEAGEALSDTGGSKGSGSGSKDSNGHVPNKRTADSNGELDNESGQRGPIASLEEMGAPEDNGGATQATTTGSNDQSAGLDETAKRLVATVDTGENVPNELSNEERLTPRSSLSPTDDDDNDNSCAIMDTESVSSGDEGNDDLVTRTNETDVSGGGHESVCSGEAQHEPSKSDQESDFGRGGSCQACC